MCHKQYRENKHDKSHSDSTCNEFGVEIGILYFIDHMIAPSSIAISVVPTSNVRKLNCRGQGSQGKKAITTHNVTTNQSGAVRSPS